MTQTLNAHANIFGNTGLAIQARHFFSALNRLTPVCLCPKYGHLGNMPMQDDFLQMLERLETINLRAPAIALDSPEEMFRFGGDIKIGYAIFETTQLSAAAVHQLQQLDQIWVPTAWGRNIIAQHGIPAERIIVIHEGFDPTCYRPGIAPFPQLAPLTGYKFLAVGKWEARKGPVELLRAFDAAFRPDDNVHLIMHFTSKVEPLHRINIAAEIDALNLQLRNKIIVIEDMLAGEADMARLYNSCDALVSATRAEGWGLPLSEAMACGRPVIAPWHSGPTEFMTADNSYPVAVTALEDIYCPVFFPTRGAHGQWAQIDIAALAEQMRHVFTHHDEARERGQRAGRELHATLTWDHAAQMAHAALQQLGVSP